MHDTVFDWPTAPMYQPVPGCHTACGKLQTTLCTPSCGWAVLQWPCGAALSFAIMLQWLPVKLRLIGYSCVIISERRLGHFSPISRDWNFPTRIVSQKSHENRTIILYMSDALQITQYNNVIPTIHEPSHNTSNWQTQQPQLRCQLSRG